MSKNSKTGRRSGLFRLPAALAVAGAMLTSILIGSSGPASAARATGSPLIFGVLGTNSGPYTEAQEGQAIEAYVANWNAHGGYKGHVVRIVDLDEALDPTLAAEAARTVVNADGAIAIVDNYGLLDCTINNSFYAASHIAVLSLLSSSACYIPKVDFTATKLGSSLGLSINSKFLAKLGAKHIGIVTPSYPGVQQLVGGAAAEAEADHVQFTQYTVPITATAADFDGAIAQMKADGVDAVIGQGQVSQEELLIQEANRQNFGPANKIPYVFGPAEYSPAYAQAFKDAYVITPGYPYSTSQGKQALSVLKHSGVKVSSYDGIAQQGYLNAGVFQAVLDSVKGRVTRASFLAAIEHATSIQMPLSPAGFKINLADPSTDKAVGGIALESDGSTFKPVSGFLVSKY